MLISLVVHEIKRTRRCVRGLQSSLGMDICMHSSSSLILLPTATVIMVWNKIAYNLTLLLTDSLDSAKQEKKKKKKKKKKKQKMKKKKKKKKKKE
jgi:hypothetical protein